MARIDYDRAAASYDRGRVPSAAKLEPWRAAIERHVLPAREWSRVLDLGSGTGIFATAIAAWFDAKVVGVEPSRGMREQARRKAADGRVAYVGGRGEAIPLHDACCDWAWLSTVVHHVADVDACARELARVVRPGGSVLIRNHFPGRDHTIQLFRFFPGAKKVAETFPTVETVTAAFSSAGFTRRALEPVEQVVAPDLATFYEAVRGMHHADSTLDPLSDEEFARDLAALARATAAETAPAPLVDRLDLLVLTRPA